MVASSSVMSPPSSLGQNVTFAVNYSFPEHHEHQFLVGSTNRRNSSAVPSTPKSSTKTASPSPTRNRSKSSLQQQKTNIENRPNQLNIDKKMLDEKPQKQLKFVDTPPVKDSTSPGSSRPRREKKRREVSREKNRVRYDMHLVPGIRRNREFIHRHRLQDEKPIVKLRPRRSNTTGLEELPPEKPFTDNASIVWIPKSRSEWEDCLSEMTAVCASADVRRRAIQRQRGIVVAPPKYDKPLSREYIRERIDIDDPLHGFQIRHKGGGWLQGYILWTNFTTWTHYFKFDSLHPRSGMKKSHNKLLQEQQQVTMTTTTTTTPQQQLQQKLDMDGSLSAELESQPRSGDPLGGGVVFDTIAEISILGGLACGEYLLRMALDDIQSSGHYKYVVLQATDTSRTFYERFGFVRVGAVSKYGSKEAFVQAGGGERVGAAEKSGTEHSSTAEGGKKSTSSNWKTEIVGYRHWTYAHETSRTLDMHGGPSYMMALRLPTTSSRGTAEQHGTKKSFLEHMKELIVSEKPKIMQLGAAPTPAAVKKKKQLSSASPVPNKTMLGSNGVTSDKKGTTMTPRTKRRRTPGVERKQKFPSDSKTPLDKGLEQYAHRDKRRKISSTTSLLMTPPKPGKSLTYAQKQYQSVWLAVPPTASPANGRKPPLVRNTGSEASTAPKNRSSSIKTKPARANKPSKKGTGITPSEHPTGAATNNVKAGLKNETEVKPTLASLVPCPVAYGPEAGSTTAQEPTKKKRKSPSPKPVDKNDKRLRKQKVTNIPRSKVHYFNKVVRRKKSAKESGSTPTDYYFVLHYDDVHSIIRIIPLLQQGELMGKRQGRPRYKALVANNIDVRIVSTSDYDIVPAYMVTKTPIVANETWDILE